MFLLEVPHLAKKVPPMSYTLAPRATLFQGEFVDLLVGHDLLPAPLRASLHLALCCRSTRGAGAQSRSITHRASALLPDSLSNPRWGFLFIGIWATLDGGQGSLPVTLLRPFGAGTESKAPHAKSCSSFLSSLSAPSGGIF